VLRRKKNKKKGRRGGAQASLLLKLNHGAPKTIKKWKKGEQVLSLPNLGNGILEGTKKERKEGASSPFSESW
jgi:hypothetical protein